MKKKIKIIIITIILCAIAGALGYFVTYKIDLAKKGGSVDVKVTFDDTETYVIPSVKKMSKEEALKEWPYKIQVENSGTAKGLYQILITDISKSIKRDNLDYVLYLDEKEIQEGNLGKIKDDILYTYEIDAKKTQKYDLYIWCSKDCEEVKDIKEEKEKKEEEKETPTYEYKLTFNVIKSGGPGF